MLCAVAMACGALPLQAIKKIEKKIETRCFEHKVMARVTTSISLCAGRGFPWVRVSLAGHPLSPFPEAVCMQCEMWCMHDVCCS